MGNTVELSKNLELNTISNSNAKIEKSSSDTYDRIYNVGSSLATFIGFSFLQPRPIHEIGNAHKLWIGEPLEIPTALKDPILNLIDIKDKACLFNQYCAKPYFYKPDASTNAVNFLSDCSKRIENSVQKGWRNRTSLKSYGATDWPLMGTFAQ